MLAAEEGLVTDVETDHGEWPAGLKDDLGGLGIVIDVCFGCSVDVSAFDGPAHENDFLDERYDGGIFLYCERDIGEWADGDERDFVRGAADELDDQIGAEARVHLALAGRQLDIGEAVFPVPELGGDELLEERMLCAGSYGDFAAIGERNHAEGVFQTLLGGGVAGNDGDGADVQLRRMERQHEGHGVIAAGVGVKNDFLAGGVVRRNLNHREKEEEPEGAACSAQTAY